MSDRDERPPKPPASDPDEASQPGSQASGAGQRRTLLQLCYLDLAEDRLREAVSMMNRAERLSPAEALPQPHKPGDAKILQSLSSLLDQTRSLLPAEEPFLESGSAGEVNEWADRILELLAARIDCGASDVGQAREDCQPWLEQVLAMLLQAAGEVGEQSRSGQQLLAQAWTVLVSCRDLELHCAALGPAEGRRSDASCEAEQEFHNALHRELLKGPSARPKGWSEPLRRLQESSRSQSVLPHLEGSLKPPRRGISLTFFLFRNLFPEAALLVLASQQGKLYPRLIPEAQTTLIPELLDWSRRLDEPAPSMAEAGNTPATPRLNLPDLLPSALRRQPGILGTGPWQLFPEGIFHALPLEVLPDGRGGCFGQKRAVQICLSRSPRKKAGSAVQWERGWLAVGAVPRAGRIPELEGSLGEMLALERLIGKRDHPTEILAGPQAHLTNLKNRLKVGQPSVLHLALQGYSDSRHSEACTLVLAGIPGIAQSELLPFGMINRMDLEHLDLVVLSATAGFEARIQSAAGIEGLIWAFLEAGAGQVIARRYPVDPTAARLFLLSLYQQLMKHPAALALGFARHECLGQLGLNRQQVGAWSIWN